MDQFQPEVNEHGVPRCSEDRCQQYDGKRCRILGHRPSVICEPAVVEMAALIKKLRQESSAPIFAIRIKTLDNPRLAGYGWKVGDFVAEVTDEYDTDRRTLDHVSHALDASFYVSKEFTEGVIHLRGKNLEGVTFEVATYVLKEGG